MRTVKTIGRLGTRKNVALRACIELSVYRNVKNAFCCATCAMRTDVVTCVVCLTEYSSLYSSSLQRKVFSNVHKHHILGVSNIAEF